MNPICSYFQKGECRSCGWIELPYREQLVKKEQLLRLALNLKSDFQLIPTATSPLLGFRNRAKMMVTGSTDLPILGLTGETNLDEGRELLQCPIHHPELNELIQALPEFIREYHLIPYHIQSRKGELKGLILFHSPDTNQSYLRFVLRSKECVSRIQKLLPSLQKKFPNLRVVSANIQPIPHAILEGKEEIFITEQKFIEHRLDEVVLNLAPQTFVQTNVAVAKQLYQTAADWIAELSPKKMLELFCGQGAFSFFAAKGSLNPNTEILGIEINEDAVVTANETAKALGLTRVTFQCMNAKDAPSIGADLILVNPPRRGLSESIQIIEQAMPKHLIYSSCSVESLAKDLQILQDRYTLKKVQIFDLFPHTEHFETLVLLEKK